MTDRSWFPGSFLLVKVDLIFLGPLSGSPFFSALRVTLLVKSLRRNPLNFESARRWGEISFSAGARA